MRRYVWVAVLVMGTLVSSVALGQKPKPRRSEPRSEAFRKMEIRHKQLDLQNREAELEFKNQMRNLQLEEREIELARKRQALKRKAAGRRDHCEMRKGFWALCAIVNLLLAIWVYQDIRKRNAGSGIWIVVTLLAGFFGALLYAIVRLGDKHVDK